MQKSSDPKYRLFATLSTNTPDRRLLKIHSYLCGRGHVWDLIQYLHRVNFTGPQSTHRVAKAAFWLTLHHDGKINSGWWGWGVHAHPLSLYLPSRTKFQCTSTLQLRKQIHSTYLYPCEYVLCGRDFRNENSTIIKTAKPGFRSELR